MASAPPSDESGPDTPDRDPPRLDGSRAIFGYTSRFSFEPGERVPIFASCEGVDAFTAQLVRLRHGYEGPAGPGLLETELGAAANGRYPGSFQAPNTGSYVVVDDPTGRLATLRSWTVELRFQPTTPAKPGQRLIGCLDDRRGAGWAVVLDAGRLGVEIGDGTGRRTTLLLDAPIERGCWYRVVAACDVDAGEIAVDVEPLYRSASVPLLASASRARAERRRFPLPFAAAPGAPLLIGAAASGLDGTPAASGHYNGKIENPTLWTAAGPDVASTAPVARWDLGRSERADGALLDHVVDVSGNALHGRCVNSPTRGCTGHAWSGREQSFRHAPDEYGAIHFHDDDLDDALWPEAFGVDLPAELPSGVYAVRLTEGATRAYVPFAVRPRRDGRREQVALLLPTGSYLAYANDRLSFDMAGTELLVAHTPVVSMHDLHLQRHYDFGGSNYEVHADGSGVLYSSRRRPIITMDPRYRCWVGADAPWQFPADLCIVDWLAAQGIAFDVITDEDLHREGAGLLAPYRVVLTGSHPEYVSEPELDALQAYVSTGGRLLYLGGNGFYWIVSYHPEKPHVMEVRRSEAGTRPHQAPPGEYHLATSGQLGALWRNKGRPPQKLVGVGFTAQGFDRSTHYLRLPDSHRPDAAFIFEGIGADERIGDFGIVGGGAAGAEVDRYDLALGTPPDALLLASSAPFSDNYNHCSEEIFETPPGIGGSEDPDVRADLVYLRLAGGGAVFSTGSIAWTGSLSHDGYDNNVSRITGNVLRRFLDPAPLER